MNLAPPPFPAPALARPSIVNATFWGCLYGIVTGIVVGCVLGFFQIGIWLYDISYGNGGGNLLVTVIMSPVYLIVGEVYGGCFGAGAGAVLGTIFGFGRAITRDGQGPWSTPQRWRRVVKIVIAVVMIGAMAYMLSRPHWLKF